MSHYKSNLRDIQFNLFEVLRRQDLLGQPPYDELDEETVRGILGELERLATGPLAESFADADRNPPVFDPATHSVRMPESLRDVLPRLHGRRVVPALAARRAGRHRRAEVAELGHGRADPRRQPGDLDVRQRATPWPGCCGTSARPSRSGSPSRPSSASGAPPWC